MTDKPKKRGRTTLEDVANEAGVNKVTVSRVLSGHRNYVSESTRKRILEVAQRLNYRPNLMAASLKTRRTYMVGIVIPDIENSFFPAVVRGAEECLRESGYYLVVCSTDQKAEQEVSYLELLSGRQCDGVIVASSGGLERFLEREEPEFPIVLIDRDVPGAEFDRVMIDNAMAVSNGVRYLTRLGHADILLVTAPYENVSVRRERVRGFVESMKQANVPERIHVIEGDAAKDRDSLVKILKSPSAPTAVFTMNPVVTTVVMNAISAAALRAPDDISVLAFDDVPWAEAIQPPLTVVRQPAYELGIRAASLLLNRLASSEKLPIETVSLHAQLVERGSCAPVREPVGPASASKRMSS